MGLFLPVRLTNLYPDPSESTQESSVAPTKAQLKSHRVHWCPGNVADPMPLVERSSSALSLSRSQVAETSITIPGIKYVVDTGRVKVNPNPETLTPNPKA